MLHTTRPLHRGMHTSFPYLEPQPAGWLSIQVEGQAWFDFRQLTALTGRFDFFFPKKGRVFSWSIHPTRMTFPSFSDAMSVMTLHLWGASLMHPWDATVHPCAVASVHSAYRDLWPPQSCQFPYWLLQKNDKREHNSLKSHYIVVCCWTTIFVTKNNNNQWHDESYFFLPKTSLYMCVNWQPQLTKHQSIDRYRCHHMMMCDIAAACKVCVSRRLIDKPGSE